MKYYNNNKYLKRNLKLYKFQFLTVIIKAFMKNKFLSGNASLLKIKNINKWFLFFFFNLWKFFRSFYFDGLLYDVMYMNFVKLFYKLANFFFWLQPIYIFKFFVRIKNKVLYDKFFIFFKILHMFFIKKHLFLRSRRRKPSRIKMLQSAWVFFFSFVEGEKFDMFGQKSFLYELVKEKIRPIALAKYKINVVNDLYDIFVNERLNDQLKFFLERKAYMKKELRKSVYMIYYVNIWLLLYKTKQRVKKYSRYFRYVKNSLMVRYKSIAIRKFIWAKDKERGLVARKLRINKLIALIKVLLKKKRQKGQVNFGNFIDYNKFKFYKKRKKFKYDKRYKGFRFKHGIIHLNSSRSNYFVTLTDLSYKPIHGVTSGRFAQSTNKKAKKSSTAIYFLLKYIFIFMKAHKINSIILEVRNRFDPLFHQCLNFFKYKKIHIYKIYLTRQLPHHKGLRKRKLRRI